MSSGSRRPTRVAVFISGGGSTLQALLEMQSHIDIALVVCNRKKAAGSLKARRFGIQTFYQSPTTTFAELNAVLVNSRIEKIFLAGYMKILPEDFVGLWKQKIFNIHPSLLPLYPGLDSAERSYQDQNDMGVTIHEVIPQMDQGKVRLQKNSKKSSEKLSLSESLLLLRRTEQHLLREFAVRNLP